MFSFLPTTVVRTRNKIVATTTTASDWKGKLEHLPHTLTKSCRKWSEQTQVAPQQQAEPRQRQGFRQDDKARRDDKRCRLLQEALIITRTAETIATAERVEPSLSVREETRVLANRYHITDSKVRLISHTRGASPSPSPFVHKQQAPFP